MLSRPYIQVPISPTIIGRTASTTLFHIVSNMFLVPMLNCLTTNEFIIKIFFLSGLPKKAVQQESSIRIGSLDNGFTFY